jgi:hypothetical protein
MHAFWIALTFAYVLIGAMIVVDVAWRMFHPRR